jgi:5-amino-6-(5-phosphoribosylamino)uracil reductase
MTTVEASERAPAELAALVDVVPCGGATVDLACVVDELVKRGMPRINCEGGPRLLGDLAAAGLLDELLLTLAPRLLGGPTSEHIVDVAGGLHPAMRMITPQVLTEDGSVLLRARRR